MATDFELGKVPASIFVSWALDMSERGLIGGNVAVDIEGYLDFVWLSAPKLEINRG